jgi:hypothetical protein
MNKVTIWDIIVAIGFFGLVAIILYMDYIIFSCFGL